MNDRPLVTAEGSWARCGVCGKPILEGDGWLGLGKTVTCLNMECFESIMKRFRTEFLMAIGRAARGGEKVPQIAMTAGTMEGGPRFEKESSMASLDMASQ